MIQVTNKVFKRWRWRRRQRGRIKCRIWRINA